MSDFINWKQILYIDNDNDLQTISKICRALSVPDRVRILKNLLLSSKNLSEISNDLGIPISSVSHHIDILADAQLILIRYQPGPKGHTKFCSPIATSFTISLFKSNEAQQDVQEFTSELPVGLFSHCHIKAPCGMVGEYGVIGEYDDPTSFFMPEHIDAECIWFDVGYISYNFSAAPLRQHKCSEISFSFEICSETVYYNNNWPSDITVYINDVEITTFTSPGDFGGRRGKYTPSHWPVTSTQFGILKKFTVNSNGVYIDNVLDNQHVVFDDLKLDSGSAIKLTIAVKEDAKHRGGVNLFGRNFGDYHQAIIMTVK